MVIVKKLNNKQSNYY